jgi:hypothetical protein
LNLNFLANWTHNWLPYFYYMWNWNQTWDQDFIFLKKLKPQFDFWIIRPKAKFPILFSHGTTTILIYFSESKSLLTNPCCFILSFPLVSLCFGVLSLGRRFVLSFCTSFSFQMGVCYLLSYVGFIIIHKNK